MTSPFSSSRAGMSNHFVLPARLRFTNGQLLIILGAILLYGRLLTSRLITTRVSETVTVPCKQNGQLKVFKDQLARCKEHTRDKQLHVDELGVQLIDAKERRGGGDSDSRVPLWRRPFGEECKAKDKDLLQFLKYTRREECPDDWPLVQELIFTYNCFHLPKRGCFAPMPQHYTEPLPLPKALWTTPSDDNVRWNNYACHNYECLDMQSNGDCDRCFRLEGPGRRPNPATANSPTVLNVDQVLALKKGSIRVGLDVAGGVGAFAALMSERNVTIITTSANEGAPFMETIALRGMVPLHLPSLQRLPFFDRALDIVHCMQSVQSMTAEQFELMVYDWDRVLRPGGIIWLQAFQNPPRINSQYSKYLKALRYIQHEWVVEDNLTLFGTELTRLHVVLEKPMGKPKKRKEDDFLEDPILEA